MENREKGVISKHSKKRGEMDFKKNLSPCTSDSGGGSGFDGANDMFTYEWAENYERKFH
jgi:hypothetical protein